MRNALAVIGLMAVTGTVQAAFLPGDTAKGKVLHDKQCLSCHSTAVYSRADRKMNNVEALIGQVNNCVHQTGMKLNRDQVNDLVKYLDETFYRFK